MQYKAIFGAAAAAVLSANAAFAVGVEFTWTDTVVAGSAIGSGGEAFTATVSMDNGGSSLLSGTWGAADFVSLRFEGASGWWAELTGTPAYFSNSFETDSSGNVTSVANFYLDAQPVTSSWSGAGSAQAFINGYNGIFYDGIQLLSATNVADNQIASNWSVSYAGAASPVPVPASLPLLGFGVAGLAGLRMRKKRAA